MKANFYNNRGDLVLGLKKVKAVKINADRSVKVVLKADDNSEIEMSIKSTDYESIETKSH